HRTATEADRQVGEAAAHLQGAHRPPGKSARDSRDSAAENRGLLRGRLVELVRQRATEVPVNSACSAVGLSRATAYRWLRPRAQKERVPRARSARRISDVERETILETLDSERFAEQPPREVYATLLSEGTYLCSVSTMYRTLRERGPETVSTNEGAWMVTRGEQVAPRCSYTWSGASCMA